MAEAKLMNDGENNCFINSVIQVLFYQEDIRKVVLEDLTCQACHPFCLLCALKDVFTFMMFPSKAVPTQPVRDALRCIDSSSVSFQSRSRGCAVETFGVILSHLHQRVESWGAHDLCLAHRFFSFGFVLRFACCEGTEVKLEKNCIYISGARIVELTKEYGTNSSFSLILNVAVEEVNEINGRRACACHAGERAQVLLQTSKLFMVNIDWQDSMKGSSKLFALFDKQRINLRAVFDLDYCEGSSIYEINSIICYSKVLKHYIAVATSSKGWSVISDDISISGSSKLIKFGLKLARLTPVILIYKQTK